MTKHEFDFRVAYADTDRMGVVYYANYLVLFERGRTELLRHMGFCYRDIEENDKVFLPVIESSCQYMAPAYYDDLIRVRTFVSDVGRASVSFRYEIENVQTGRALVKGSTKHPFVSQSWKPVRAPEKVRKALLAAKEQL